MSLAALPPIAQASAGSLGAVTSNTILYPLDLITTRAQTKSRTSGKKYPNAGLTGSIAQILRDEGVAGFYKGLGSDTLSTLISNFLYFYSYSFLRRTLLDHSRRSPSSLPSPKELLIGSLAGMFSRLFTTPLTTIKVRQQTATSQTRNGESPFDDEVYNGVPSSLSIARDVLAEKGWTGFWSGYKAACIITLNPAISLYLFESFKMFFIPRKFRDKPSTAQTFFLSAIASAIATAITYPLILAKTRLQHKNKSNPSGNKSKSIFSVLRECRREKNSWTGMYVGLESQILKGFFSQGITMVVKQRIELLIIFLYRILVLNKKRKFGVSFK